MNQPLPYEELLQRFRDWLDEARREADSLGEDQPMDARAAEAEPEIGLLQLVEQFTALRQELKLQTKGSRNLEEQMREAVEAMEKATAMLRAAESRHAAEARQFEAVEAVARPLAEALAELDEAFERSRRAAETARERFAEEMGDRLFEELDERFQQQSRWRRWLGRRWYHAARKSILEQVDRVDAEAFGLLLDGFSLVHSRLRRALEQNRIERIRCIGQPVDPDRMTVLDITEDSDTPPGHVAEEIRPGYLWNGKVVRYAEVKAARSGQTVPLGHGEEDEEYRAVQQ